MGAMQVLIAERLWRRQRWMSWRTQLEYLIGSLWWLEGVATLVTLAVPATLLVTGAATSTVAPGTFLGVFAVTFALRLWGYKLLLRRQIRWRTAFALRVLRVPVGMSCVWWLLSRRTLQFAVTPKGASNLRYRGRVPRTVVGLMIATLALVGYAALGLAGHVPWRSDAASTVTSGLWLVIAFGVLLHAVLRIRAEQYATTRRAAHRFPVNVPVQVDGRPAELVDVSVNGAAVRLETGETVPGGYVTVSLPGAAPLKMEVAASASEGAVTKLTLPAQDWEGLRTLALWLFHTPRRTVAGLPAGVPIVAITSVRR
jgi:cellulose synthase (UDP-forming)